MHSSLQVSLPISPWPTHFAHPESMPVQYEVTKKGTGDKAVSWQPLLTWQEQRSLTTPYMDLKTIVKWTRQKQNRILHFFLALLLCERSMRDGTCSRFFCGWHTKSYVINYISSLCEVWSTLTSHSSISITTAYKRAVWAVNKDTLTATAVNIIQIDWTSTTTKICRTEGNCTYWEKGGYSSDLSI